eukprot:g868.t1
MLRGRSRGSSALSKDAIELNAVNNGKVYLSGNLKKKSSKGKWQKRYFKVTRNYLLYFKSENSKKCSGRIDLAKCSPIEVNEPNKFSFKIDEDRTYELEATDALQWAQTLNERRQQALVDVEAPEAQSIIRQESESDVKKETSSSSLNIIATELENENATDMTSQTAKEPKESSSLLSSGEIGSTNTGSSSVLETVERKKSDNTPTVTSTVASIEQIELSSMANNVDANEKRTEEEEKAGSLSVKASSSLLQNDVVTRTKSNIEQQEKKHEPKAVLNCCTIL